MPTVIVDDSVFNELEKDVNPSVQKESSVYTGIDISQKMTYQKQIRSLKK